MKDNEPNINVPLLASKGKGWEKEWEKIQQYVFVGVFPNIGGLLYYRRLNKYAIILL